MSNGCKIEEAVEVEIPVPWGHISGKRWGPGNVQPILMIHGWQDNAGSFDPLVQLLPPGTSVLSIDLPGHGLSSHLPDGQFYYIMWDGVLYLRRVAKYYKWDKWWGSKEIQPIVALHGRQDNAGSFDKLIPLFPNNISVLCLDLPGHGLSSHYPTGQSYYVHWDGIILLRRIVLHYKWNKVKLLGHSLGGAISFLYAASYPDEVEFVISLDIASPSVRDITKSVDITGTFIDRFLKYENLTLENVPCYEYNEMINIVEDAYNGDITRESAEILMKRGMQRAAILNHYYFRRDPRLKVSLLGMLSMDLVMAFAAKIKCAYLNIRAVPGMKFEQPESYQKVLGQIKLTASKFEYREVEGSHHVHLNNPEKVAPIIMEFLGL